MFNRSYTLFFHFQLLGIYNRYLDDWSCNIVISLRNDRLSFLRSAEIIRIKQDKNKNKSSVLQHLYRINKIPIQNPESVSLRRSSTLFFSIFPFIGNAFRCTSTVSIDLKKKVTGYLKLCEDWWDFWETVFRSG